MDSSERSKRYSDKLISDKIIFLNYRQTFYQNTRKTYGRRFVLSIFFKFPVRRHLSMGFNRESVTLLLQVLWISVSVNIGQYRQQHCNGEDSYSDADHYSNKEEAECFSFRSYGSGTDIIDEIQFSTGNLSEIFVRKTSPLSSTRKNLTGMISSQRC